MFSLDQYKTLLADLNNGGLFPSIEWNRPPTKNTLFLRHDVDFSIDFAHTLAKFEADLGVQSTFFFMLLRFFDPLGMATDSQLKVFRLPDE